MQKFITLAVLLAVSFSSVFAVPVPVPQGTDVEDAVMTAPDGTIIPFTNTA
ncbi:hypothetical protein TWF696_007821 [Orbilia brochopaga]|uniref:Uncharacterized protein n=1 Tax=Orbilia brochopaga TaxID=3140254 RepID=A0AAV9UM18_9PEZI